MEDETILDNIESATEAVTEVPTQTGRTVHFMGSTYSLTDFIISAVVLVIIIIVIFKIIGAICSGIKNAFSPITDPISNKIKYNKMAKEAKNSLAYNGHIYTQREQEENHKAFENDYWEDVEHSLHRDLLGLKKIKPYELPEFGDVDKKNIKGIAFNNVYLRDLNDDQDTCALTQVDEMLVTFRAIYFIECKTYSGYVKPGAPDAKYWKHESDYVYSPYLQNQQHINFFKKMCKINADYSCGYKLEQWESCENVPMYNIICFSDKTDVEECINENYIIVHEKNLINLISKLENKPLDDNRLISLREISEYLEECTKTDAAMVKRHLDMAINKENEV